MPNTCAPEANSSPQLIPRRRSLRIERGGLRDAAGVSNIAAGLAPAVARDRRPPVVLGAVRITPEVDHQAEPVTDYPSRDRAGAVHSRRVSR
jgi:hypothetical protein